jgi:hypothetical protein
MSNELSSNPIQSTPLYSNQNPTHHLQHTPQLQEQLGAAEASNDTLASDLQVAQAQSSGDSGPDEISETVKTGVALLQRVLETCPGMTAHCCVVNACDCM